MSQNKTYIRSSNFSTILVHLLKHLSILTTNHSLQQVVYT